MKYLLDTHVLVWWHTASTSLAAAHRRLIEREHARGSQVAVSGISLWEVAQLAKRGRLRAIQPARDWLQVMESDPRLEFLPISAAVAEQAASLGPPFPADPADRIIAATALVHGFTLLTEDDAIRASRVVPLA